MTFTRSKGVVATTCRVEADVHAEASTVWRVLTDAKAFPHWNRTITLIEGDIREGARLRIHAPGSRRTITRRVSGVVPSRRMVWSAGVVPLYRRVRTFTLEPRGDGWTKFTMEERFSGVVFALVQPMLASLRPVFETYAIDLKHAAEHDAISRNGARAALRHHA
ncbi:MAG TPA: SRPBCC domain-containing protein [Candidatus Polarisedimenticolaceae bacterium]|nr:SRPBCC domain-containing protein [Candidatus Polarisedimenticolaceae bacterium]